jgi:UDP-2-acetamido-3-amino-2,3-dideoxy-glucuronate N-acetyltransferase
VSGHIDPTAIIHPSAQVGEDTNVWAFVQIREGARIGRGCIIGSGAYIGVGVVVGDRCKIENGAMLFAGAVLESGVFVGPQAMLINDRHPRAVNWDGTLKTKDDWLQGVVHVGYGASIGAGAIVFPDVDIEPWATVAAGEVVRK